MQNQMEFPGHQPGSVYEPLYPPAPAPQLRVLWPAFAAVVLAALLQWIGSSLHKSDEPSLLAAGALIVSAVLVISAYVYYFMYVHRLITVLTREPGWQAEYTPAGAVWRQFIPFYNLVFSYRWTSDVTSYCTWRLQDNSRSNLPVFLTLLIGFGVANFVPSLGLLMMFGALYLLDRPVRKALATQPPDGGAPGFSGTLNLR